MRKYVFLALVMFLLVFAVAGCQPRLSEDEVRAIVREEIAAMGDAQKGLAAADYDAIRAEVARQLGDVSRMTVSELVITDPSSRHAVMTLKATETTEAGVIIMANSEGVITHWIGADTAGRGVHLVYGPGEQAAHVIGINEQGHAVQIMYNADGKQIAAFGALESGTAKGVLRLYDAEGNLVFTAEKDAGSSG